MSLVLETGAGVAGANSYVSLTDALSYHADHGNATWAASSDPLRTAALIRGASAIDGMYGGRWPGFRASISQGLDWPRSGAWDRDGYPLLSVPADIVRAACEAALVELDTPGALSQKATAGLKSQTVGPITQVWTGSSGAGGTAYPTVRQALSRIIKGGGNIDIGGR